MPICRQFSCIYRFTFRGVLGVNGRNVFRYSTIIIQYEDLSTRKKPSGFDGNLSRYN